MKRRLFLKTGSGPLLGALGGAGVLSGLSSAVSHATSGSDYKALVCVFLTGGNDGHNSLIPTDGAYTDYAAARPILALPKESLIALNGSSTGHTFALHPALAPLATLYNQQRVAWIANAGPLVVPATARQVIDNAVPIPPFLMSHSDQQAMQQGWNGDADVSGWAGRGLEALPVSLNNALRAVTMDNNRTLVLGQHSAVAFMNPDGAQYWGRANLAQPQNYWTQMLNNMASWQFSNDYEAEYARTMGGAVAESTILTQALAASKEPAASFGSDQLAKYLRGLARTMPVFKSMGYRRQIFLVNWGGFDTHYAQRGNTPTTQDAQLETFGNAMAAFDQANRASGLDLDVTTLMMSDFGRTLRPASGAGSDHAWGNHWLAMGGAVAGGQVVGKFPTLTLGGPDDADPNKGGRMVPSTSTDQVGATVMQWLGLPASAQAAVFPNLANFSAKTLNFMKA